MLWNMGEGYDPFLTGEGPVYILGLDYFWTVAWDGVRYVENMYVLPLPAEQWPGPWLENVVVTGVTVTGEYFRPTARFRSIERDTGPDEILPFEVVGDIYNPTMLYIFIAPTDEGWAQLGPITAHLSIAHTRDGVPCTPFEIDTVWRNEAQNLGDVASEAEMLALAASHSDYCVRTDLTPAHWFQLTGYDPAVLGDWTDRGET